MQKRDIDLLVISDIHLGTYGCHAKDLLQYLHSIQPKTIVLNGDIIDIWQFSKRYWPATHTMVLRYFMDMMAAGVPVYYIIGNHDEMLRKFEGFHIGSLKICNKLSLKLNNERIWIFHGDVFDVVMQHSKWLAKLGAIGYDTLILINRFANFISEKLGRGKLSLSKKVKDSVKSAVAFINKFEATVCDIAASNHYQYVICGHIHEPSLKTMVTPHGAVRYLNSGDWIENLTSLEYANGEWQLYHYLTDPIAKTIEIDNKPNKETSKELFESFLAEMKTMQNENTE